MFSSSLRMRRQAPMAIALALVVAPLTLASPASAVSSPSGLAPKAVSVSGIPVLRWKPVRGAAEYTVEVSDSKTFSDLLFEVDTENIYAVPDEQLPAGKIWWRVQAEAAGGTRSRWSQATFVRKQPGGPVLVAPESGEVLSQPAEPPLLRWKPVPGATQYEVEIDTAEHDWVETKTYTTQSTSLVVPDPQRPGAYWWRVRATLDGSLRTKPSGARSYKVAALPTVGDAGLVPTGSGADFVEDVVFDWAPVPGAVSYDIRVSTDDSFNTIIDSRAVKGTRYSPTTTYDNTNYWWQVRSRDIFGQAEEWNKVPVRVFRRAWPEKAELVWPQDRQQVGDDFYYQWTPVEKAASYRLDIGSDPNFSPGTYDTCYTTQTSYAAGFAKSPSEDKCMPVPGATYYWRVQALDDPGKVNGVISEVRAFVYDPGTVTQTSPAAGAIVDIPTLMWEPVDDAVKYKVILSKDGRQIKTATTHSYSWTYTGRAKLAKGDYTWTVQSVDQNGDLSPLPSSGQPFSVSGTVPAGSSPLVPSASGSSSRFPVLTWGAHPDATHYRVKIADHGFNFYADLGLDFAYPAATDESDIYLRPGTYDWYVEAYKGTARVGDGAGLPKGSFTISDLGSVSGQRIALDASGLKSGTGCSKSLASGGICDNTRATPVLDWESVPDAGFYLIYLSYDRELTNLVYGNKADPKTLPATQNTRWTPTEALEESQAGGAYYWYVRPCKSAAACAEDPTQATHAFRKKSNTVERLLPTDGATVQNDVTFTWTDYLASNLKPALKNPETGEQAGQSAQSYRIEVAEDMAFTKLVDSAVVDQTTYTAFSKTYPEGTLFWRVQAIDGSKNGLAWSDAWKFVKKSPAPTLTSPADGAVVGGTPPLSWKPLNFAASYDIEVYKNADKNASAGNRVISVTSNQASYAHIKALPASAKSYVWRVRRNDADRRDGAWSAWRSFKVGAPAPGLVAPKASASVNGRAALFTWRASKAAASYRIELKHGGSIEESGSTVATAWAPSNRLERGKWQWRVIALDANRQTLRASGWRSFNVK